ncbi:IGHE protein, partial [Oreocharis arfaki]|nr:IGHE protein [Oreocharis arfaki]
FFPFFPPGKRLPPSVFLLPPPPEETSSSRPTLSLTCLVRGFFPDSVDVQWQKNQENVGNSGNSGAETGPA